MYLKFNKIRGEIRKPHFDFALMKNIAVRLQNIWDGPDMNVAIQSDPDNVGE